MSGLNQQKMTYCLPIIFQSMKKPDFVIKLPKTQVAMLKKSALEKN